jgi:hemoglobin/transferrin/lactoferrin receptor protein
MAFLVLKTCLSINLYFSKFYGNHEIKLIMNKIIKSTIKKSIIVCALFQSTALWAQNSDSIVSKPLQEVVISGSKNPETRDKIAQNITLITNKRIKEINANATGELLQQTGEVYLQKSQAGGGSPIIRGFEASRVLLVLDGVRMNNAIYRAGHLQNIITVDQNILDRIEVLQGSSSTLYGSDALGGVVVMNTLQHQFARRGQTIMDAHAMARFSSAIRENTVHGDISFANERLSSISSITASKFGDVRTGQNYKSRFGDWGKNLLVAGFTANGADTTLPNNEPHIQKNSGYSQLDLMQKIAFKQNKSTTHMLNLQLSTSTDISRFDRLSEVSGGKVRWAQWYYGPQQRTLASYTLQYNNKNVLFGRRNVVVAHQYINESRHQRRLASASLQSKVEDVNVVSLDINATHDIKAHEITVGIDGQLNFIKSVGTARNISTGAISEIDSRYPNGKNRMHYGNLYAQHIYKNKNLAWNNGLRLSFTDLNSTIANTKVQLNLPYNKITQSTQALTGSTGINYSLSKFNSISLSYNSGFRAPNLDDMTKIFETSASNGVVVPNPTINAERTHQIEISSRNVIAKQTIVCGVYNTWLRNYMVLDNFLYNGKDSILYNDTNRRVLAMQNKDKGNVFGIFVNIRGDVTKRISYYGSYNAQTGKYFTATGTVPLDHVPPTFGNLGIKYASKEYFVEAFCMFNDLKAKADYSPSGEDNLQYATAVGMPSWYTLNLRTAYKVVPKYFTVALSVENILDTHYRLFASGISAPGRNIGITLRSEL